MAFNLSTIQSDTRFLIFSDSTDTTYADTDLNRNANSWYQKCIAWVLSVNGDWQVNGDKATTDLVEDQQEYILPTDILKLNEVYIKYVSTGEYIKATQRDPKNIHQYADSDYNPSTPEFDLLDNSIFVYLPDDIEDITAGIRIHFQSNLTELSDSGDLPNIAEPFKRIISYGAALDFCIANEMSRKARELEQQIEIAKNDMLEFYASRSTVKKVRLEPEENNYY